MSEYKNEMEKLNAVFNEAQNKYMLEHYKEHINILNEVEVTNIRTLLPKVKKSVAAWVKKKASEKNYICFENLPSFSLSLDTLGEHEAKVFPYIVFNFLYLLGKEYPSVVLNLYNLPSYVKGEEGYSINIPRDLKSEVQFGGDILFLNQSLNNPVVKEKSSIHIIFS